MKRVKRVKRIVPAFLLALAVALGFSGTARAGDDDEEIDDRSSSAVEMWPPTESSWPPMRAPDNPVAAGETPIIPVR